MLSRETKSGHQGFEKFWRAYPRRVARKDALKAWIQLNPSEELTQTILATVELHRKQEQWQRDSGMYIPYPASYIRGERWQDEIELAPEMPQCDWNRAGTRDVGAPRCAEQAVKEHDGQFYCAPHCTRLGMKVVRGA